MVKGKRKDWWERDKKKKERYNKRNSWKEKERDKENNGKGRKEDRMKNKGRERKNWTREREEK